MLELCWLLCILITGNALETKTILVRDPYNNMDTFFDDRLRYIARPDHGKSLTVHENDFSDATTIEAFCKALWQLNTESVPKTKFCSIYDDQGEIVPDFRALVNGSAISIVPEGLPFIWPARKIGDVVSSPGKF